MTEIITQEIKFKKASIDSEFDFKLKHARKFINKGYRVQISLLYEGKIIINKNEGSDKLLELANQLIDIAEIHQEPTLNKRLMIMILKPKNI